jgi:undecaprenyl-phosphate 4-deoxy-4-formamido-L-arabinose transferase
MKTLPVVVNEITETIKKTGYEYEIILINDNAPDATYETIRLLCSQDTHIIGATFSRNFGQHAAQMAGFSFVNGDVMISADDDGQSPIEEMGKLLDKINEGYDAVFSHFINRKQGLFREFGSWMNNWMSEILTDKPKGLKTGNFYAMRRFAVDEIVNYRNAYPYIAGLLFRATKNITNVEVNYRRRISGVSNYNLKKMISMWLNGFTAFSVKPLRIASILGSIIAVMGFLFGIYIITKKMFDTRYVLSGWSSTISMFLFIGGMIMLMLGIIGEYIGRIYISINNSPQYVIKEIVNQGLRQKRG